MQGRRRLSRREFGVVAAGGLAVAAAGVGPARAAAPRFPSGVFVTSPEATVELQAYADHHGFGRLSMSHGLLADIPVVARAPVVVCNVAHWWLQTVWSTSQRILYDDNAERRELSYTTRRYSMTTVAAYVHHLDGAAEIAKLLAAVGATDANPGYLVVAISNGALVRDYLAEVRPDG